jgi:glycosyltransferase 2 family protein
MIMQQLGVRIGFREHFKIYCLTRIAGRIPGAPWHLVGRAVLYKRLEVSNSVMGVATGLEMLLVVVSGLLSGILVWFVLPPTTQMQFIWLGPILFIGVILTHPTFIQRILKKLGQGEVGVHLRYRDILLVLVVFVVGWAAGGIVLYLAILALYPLSLTQLPAVIGAWGISGAVSLLVFFSPTAFGIKEITLSLILSLLVPGGLAILVTILMRLFLTAAEFVAAILASRL